MKKIIFFISLISFIFYSCNGSDAFQGKWKAMNPKGEKFEIEFSPKKISIKDSSGKSSEYKYVQNSIKSENSIETYGIRLSDGRGYQIYFPKNDESVGLMMDENGSQMFTISRAKYLTYEDIYKLN